MIRLTGYVLVAVLLALAAAWIVARPGTVLLVWQDWELHFSVATLAALLLLYSLGLWLGWRLWRRLKDFAPLKAAARRRRQRGLAELDRGWSALALEDMAAARRHARRARGLLGQDHSAALRLLSRCETGTARQDILEQLRRREDTAPLALKELLDAALEAGNDALALSLARDLDERRPGTPWVLRRIFDIEAQVGKWAEAETSLETARKKSAYGAEEARRLAALLLYARAGEAEAAGQKDRALELTRRALKKDAGFLPAAGLAARLLTARGETDRARKIIEAAWKVRPHPELAALFLDLEPLESATERFRRVSQLVRLSPDHRESLHLLAEHAIAAGHWPEAKQALDRIGKAGEDSARSWRVRALLEQKQKQDEKAAEALLDKARTAPAEPHWRCRSCGHRPDRYAARCPHCHRFDGLHWTGS